MEHQPTTAGRFPHTAVSGFVLAGGRSVRLGQDKVLLPWNGRTLLQHSIDRLRQVCGEVRVCGDRPDLDADPRSGIPWIRDAVSGAGPLGGIVAALEQSRTEWNLFLAVDLPLVPVALLKALVEQTNLPDSHPAQPQCILAAIDSRPQPLCGLYHRDLGTGMKRALLKGDFKIMLALRDALASAADRPTSQTPSEPPMSASPNFNRAPSALQLLHVEDFAATLGAHSNLPPADWFLNINTPEDWRLARARAGDPPPDPILDL